MDPAAKAADELNAIFSRLEVPCEVCVTGEAGKHMRATANLAEGFALVEELPIVSWPSASLLDLHLPFCFHCLRLSTHQLQSTNGEDAPPSNALPPQWTRCAPCASSFCSAACQQACARVHRLLCPSLAQLRSSCSASAAAIASGITVEALARCVAWIAQRLSAVIEQQKLTYDVLQADYMAQRATTSASPDVTAGSAAAAAGESGQTAWSQDSLNYQLFTQVVAPFSRLIGPPDSVRFDGVSLPSWIASVRSLLAERCVKVLLVASGAALGELQLNTLHFGNDEAKDGHPLAAAAPLHWAEALVNILFSTDTLRTLVGQMVLNAHGVNDYVLPASASASPVKAAGFEWILKGAGLYALLSSFNHSCEPNATVSNVDETHEIVLKTTQAVQAGEEITITYIPLTDSTTLAERQQLLKNYFFTCRCARCLREGKV